MTTCMETSAHMGRLSISQEEVMLKVFSLKAFFGMQKVWFSSGDLTLFYFLVLKVILTHFNMRD